MGLPSFSDFVARIGKDAHDLATEPLNTAYRVVSGYDLNERTRVRHEQAAGNTERDDIYARQAGLSANVGGFDDPVLTSPEAFEAMSHEQIKSAVDAMNGEALRASAAGWKRIGESLEKSLTEFRDFITSTIGDNWQGIAADSAKQATAHYANKSATLAAAGQLIGSKIEEAATGVNQVKATVPPVAERSILDTVVDAVLPTTGLLKRLVHEQDEAHQEAIQIMRTVYTPVMHQADTHVPTLPEPPRIANLQQPGTPSGIGALGAGTPTSYTPYTPYHAPTPGSPTTGAPLPTALTTTSPSPGPGTFDPAPLTASNPDPDAINPNTPATQFDPSDAWTAPAAVNPVDSARLEQSGMGPLGAGLGASYPGSHGSSTGLGGAGTSTGTGGASGLSPGGVLNGRLGSSGSSPGAGASGTTSAATGTGTGTSATSATTGRGSPGATGMMPGAGARGRSDSDSEHKTPGYLLTVDNGNDLIGRLPLAAPPVIGT